MSHAAGTETVPPAGRQSLGQSIRQLSHKWGWFVALGALLVIGGIAALITVIPATIVSALWVGAILLAFGVFEIVAAFQFKDWGRFFLWIVMGGVYIAAGVLTFVNPLLAAATLTLLIGIALVISGGVRIYLATQMRDTGTWGLVALSGVITAVLGVLILVQWPASGLYVLGIFLGIDMLFAGMGWISTGLAIRRLTDGR